MARITPVNTNNISPAIQVAFERNQYTPCISNMKATLGHSLPAFDAYMYFYPLFDSVRTILGERLANLFAYGISRGAQCAVCSVYFMKQLIDAGEDPNSLLLSGREKDLVDFGGAIAKCHGNIANHLFNDVSEYYSERELVTLIAFAGQVIAFTIFNNLIETDLDEHLVKYAEALKPYWH